MTRTRARSEGGYTLIELMVVMCVIGILSGMAVLQIGSVRPGMQADGAMRMMMGQLNYAREIAVAQRREVEVRFIGTHQVDISRRDFPVGNTLLTRIALEGGVHFLMADGVGDTPDHFSPTGALPAPTLLFGSDGMLIDASGAPMNGTIYLSIPGAPQSQRAITILGSTGRVRGYRWLGGSDWTRA